VANTVIPVILNGTFIETLALVQKERRETLGALLFIAVLTAFGALQALVIYSE
jgi:hypothetical protein